MDIAAATEENDPNERLHKQGGYTAQVYFSSDLVEQSQVPGSSITDKGIPIWGDCHSIGAGTGRHRLPGKNEIQQVL